MSRLCARPACSAPAAATFNFDGLNRIVWLNALEASPAFTAGDLCWRHADELRPPRNWELRDRRPARSLGPAASAPSRQLPPSTGPSRRLGRRSTAGRRRAPGAPAPRRSGTPEPVAPEEVPTNTPLLARAFRGVGGV
jgi:hypothetical protein